MKNSRENREVLTILFLCLLWYIISSSNNVVGKMLLSEFPYPMTATMVQLTSITLYSGPFFNLWGVRKYSNDITWGYYFRLIVPLALGKFLASVFGHVSIWKVPVSYAHTGKYTDILTSIYVHVLSDSVLLPVTYFFKYSTNTLCPRKEIILLRKCVFLF